MSVGLSIGLCKPTLKGRLSMLAALLKSSLILKYQINIDSTFIIKLTLTSKFNTKLICNSILS